MQYKTILCFWEVGGAFFDWLVLGFGLGVFGGSCFFGVLWVVFL